MNPEIKKFLENLSLKMSLTEEDDILSMIPGKSDDDAPEKLLNLLTHSAEIFSNSYCFRPPLCLSLVKAYTDGEYLSVVRKIKKSDRAIFIYLLRLEPRNSGQLSLTVKYEISICEFNLKKTVGSVSNIRKITADSCRLINCREIFSAVYSKKKYASFIPKAVKLFKKIFGVEEKIQDKILKQLEQFEKEITWFIENNLITMR